MRIGQFFARSRRRLSLGVTVAVLLGALLSAPTALADTSTSTPTPPPPPPAPVAQADAPPPETQWSYAYPTGRWVYTVDHGWIWVPSGATTTVIDEVPYVYLYTPASGWTWYVSPWGLGPYHYGTWVVRPWRPVAWPGAWVAHPHVVVQLGHPYVRPWHGRYGRWGRP
jgi:hypothetical protein